MTCTEKNCTRDEYLRRLCLRHYAYRRYHKLPMPPARRRAYGTKPIVDRFWAKVAKDGKGGCWRWLAGKSPNGYGVLGAGIPTPKKVILAHRFSWTLHSGPIPPGLFVCHRCDNPECCNPAHLFLGDQAANMHDCAIKGRTNKPFGNRNAVGRGSRRRGGHLGPR